MKNIVFLIMAALTLSIPFFTGCKASKEANTEKSVTAGDVKKEAREALETASQFTEQQKKEYQATIESRLREIGKKLEDMKSGADRLKEEARSELKKEMENLEKKKADAEQKLAQLKTETGKAWEDIKNGLDKALVEIDEAYEKASSRFR